MSYRITIDRNAQKELRRISDPTLTRRLQVAINALADDPRPPGSIPLQGQSGQRRIKVGGYRVLYVIDDAARVITIGRVRPRGNVYRGL